MSPDPAFVRFFDVEFQRELDVTQIPGMADASWDRKAAWLLFRSRLSPSADRPTPTPQPPKSVFD